MKAKDLIGLLYPLYNIRGQIKDVLPITRVIENCSYAAFDIFFDNKTYTTISYSDALYLNDEGIQSVYEDYLKSKSKKLL